MGQSEYNEAQFEIEKAEAVKEARNAALEEACGAIDVRMKLNIQDLTQAQIDSGNYPEIALILQELLNAAAAIRALKMLAILLPLLFVFGVAAGESDVSARRAPASDRENFGQLNDRWTRRNADRLTETEKAALYLELQIARNKVTGRNKPIQPYPTGK